MKVTLNVDCSAAEARAFLGLPDVTEVNEAYAAALMKAVRGLTSIDQLHEYAKQIAPTSQKLFKQMFEAGAGAAFANFAGRDKGKKRDDPNT